MECGKQNIKIVEGNEFALVLPLKQRTFVASTPIDEDIVYVDLQDVVLKIGDTQFTPTLETYGVQVLVPYDALTRGTYDILLTATYHGSVIRASYFEALTIVQYNSQSDAQQYIAGSPIVLDAAYVIGGTLTDAELEALKEEYREKNSQLQQAIEDAEAAKAEWEQKAADLEGVAKESTSQDILTAVESIDIDTSDLAKEATLQGVGADAAAAKTAAQNAETAAGQAKTAAEATQTAVSALPTLQQMRDAGMIPVNYGGFITSVNPQPTSPIYLYKNRQQIVEIYDDTTTEITEAKFFQDDTQLQKITLDGVRFITQPDLFLRSKIRYCRMNNLAEITASSPFYSCSQLSELYLPNLNNVSTGSFLYACPVIRKVDISRIRYIAMLASAFGGCNDLIELHFGIGLDTNFSINLWNPTNALNSSISSLIEEGELFANNLEKFLYNVRTYIAANLDDRSGMSSLTITFHANVKAAILADAATMTAFTNKNWTIA